MGAAARIGVDLVAGLVVGTGIGWGLDRWLGTQPWLMIVFFVLGAAAGFRNVYRSAQRLAGISSTDDVNADDETPSDRKEKE